MRVPAALLLAALPFAVHIEAQTDRRSIPGNDVAIFKPLLESAELDERPERPPDAPEAELTLVFVRSPRGRVTVLRWTDTIESLTAYLDGERPLSEAIDAAALPPREGLEIANALLDAGVLIPV